LEKLVETLRARVLAKDQEFQKERESWKRREAEYKRTIRELRGQAKPN
jgi:hypothetical protein